MWQALLFKAYILSVWCSIIIIIIIKRLFKGTEPQKKNFENCW